MTRLFRKNNASFKITVYILTVALLLTSLIVVPIPVLSTEIADPYITCNGEKINELTIKEDEKLPISVAGIEKDNLGYVWQIMDKHTEGRWIDISEIHSKELLVSYSLIGSMLRTNGTASLRCKLKDGDTELFTNSVEVTVSFTANDDFATSIPYVYSAPALYAAEQDKGTCSIVINYLFDNNAIAFEPYGASIAKGSSFSAEVESPTVVGYAPFRRVGDSYIDASIVEIDLVNVQQDVIINVIYEPALVEFSIHHHLQNLLDDEYSLHYDYITTSQALTGSTVGDGLALTEEQLPGFKALAYDHLTVAADGSTVIEIFYDRNYYLIDFDLNGGFGTEPVYTRYGATVGANTPTRHGYVFAGWELISYGDDAPTNEQKSKYEISSEKSIIVPEANLRYKAIWITQNTEYTMVFWKENADDYGYTYWGYLDGLVAMSGSYVDGQDLISQVAGIDDEKYFTFNSEKTDKQVLVEGDGSTVVNVYYTRNYYTLTFEAPGLCTIPEKHTHGDECYRSVCDLGHTHTDSCIPILSCDTPEHTAHDSSCISCGITEHIHGSVGCNCTLPEHTHSPSCWGSEVGDPVTPSNPPKRPSNGQIYSYRSFISRIYCIYINGTWYKYNGSNVSNNTIVNMSCGYSTEHTHGTDCSCNSPEHTHQTSCYKDKLHTHNTSCYTYSCGQIAHTHSNNCLRLICGITQNHSHDSSCKKSSSTNTVKTVYAKYEQSLSHLWPITDDNGVVYDDGERWDPSAYYSEVLVYMAKMPPQSFTLTRNTSSYSPYTMNYYLQVLPGEKYDVTVNGKNYLLDNVIKARYNYVTKAEDFFDIAGFTQASSSPSFSGNQISISGNNRVVNFYYDRTKNQYLRFNNNGNVVRQHTGIMYGASINSYYFVPDYPDNLEPGAYTFSGWYTSPGCFDGTEVDWNTITMPEGDIMLYAKWVPITHTVKVFKDATLTEQIGEAQTVNHKTFAHAPSEAVTNGNYVFQGWFYSDTSSGTTVEKAFVFTGIPIIKDMNIYAKWSSHVSVDYRINYVLRETGEPIADPTVGSVIAGSNKTFDAKAGTDLYPGFQAGFYPLVNSHTITMSVDGVREFTFQYVYVEEMPYTIEYRDLATGATLAETVKIYENNLSVVTETFLRVEGMMPDAYQKRLVLSASGTDEDGDGILDQNKIVFYYNSDAVHAYYRVVHYIQNISGDNYREYRSTEFVGEIGNEYVIEAITLTGFSFAPERTTLNGNPNPINGTGFSAVLDADGLLVELYYDRDSFEYTVKYVDVTTGEEIAAAKTELGLFGAQIPEYAADLSRRGYELVSDDLRIITISANAELNTVEFAYKEKTVSIKYEIVGPAGCGALSMTSENVTAISGKANGSSPLVNNGFRFEGWFTDPACTKPVDSSLVNASNKLTPTKADNAIWSDKVYYAKFIALKTDLKINVASAIDSDEQSFIFNIVGKAGTDTAAINLTLSINGNGEALIKELPVGEYTITQLTSWSWRYNPQEEAKNLALAYSTTPTEITFVQLRENGLWLDGNAFENIF